MVGLVSAALFKRINLSGLAIIAGFAVTIYLAMPGNFTLDAHSASQKIVLLGMISAALGLLLGLISLPWFGMLLPILGGAAAIWTVQRILQQQSSQDVLVWGAACAAYVAVLVWGMDKLENSSPRAASAATALGLGTGAAALVGASASLGQIGLALGSAAAAHLMIQMFTNQTLPTGRVFTLPLAMIAGLSGCLAVLGAKLPWYALLFLACIPIAARLVPLPAQSIRKQGVLLVLLTSFFACGAIYFTWRVAGDVPF